MQEAHRVTGYALQVLMLAAGHQWQTVWTAEVSDQVHAPTVLAEQVHLGQVLQRADHISRLAFRAPLGQQRPPLLLPLLLIGATVTPPPLAAALTNAARLVSARINRKWAERRARCWRADRR